jgi:chromosome segregation ATPase
VCAEKDAEIAALRRRAADAETAATTLKRQLEQAQERPAGAPSGGTDWAKAYSKLWGDHARLSRAHDALAKQLADVRAANPGVGPAEEKAAGKLAREVERLTAEIAKRDELLAGEPSTIGRMERELKAAKTRGSNLTREPNAARKVRDEANDTQRKVIDLAKRAFRKLRAAPHPDGETNRERNAAKTEVAQAINQIMDDTMRDFDRIARPRRP